MMSGSGRAPGALFLQVPAHVVLVRDTGRDLCFCSDAVDLFRQYQRLVEFYVLQCMGYTFAV